MPETLLVTSQRTCPCEKDTFTVETYLTADNTYHYVYTMNCPACTRHYTCEYVDAWHGSFRVHVMCWVHTGQQSRRKK